MISNVHRMHVKRDSQILLRVLVASILSLSHSSFRVGRGWAGDSMRWDEIPVLRHDRLLMYNYWTLLNTNADHWLIARRIIVTIIAIRVAAPATAGARLVLMRQLNGVAVVAVDGERRVAAHRMMIWPAASAAATADDEWWVMVGQYHDVATHASASAAGCDQIYRQRCRRVVGLLDVSRQRRVVAAVAVVVHVLLKISLVDDIQRHGRGPARQINARRRRQCHLNGWLLLYTDDRWWIAVHRVNVVADQDISSSLRTWWYQR